MTILINGVNPWPCPLCAGTGIGQGDPDTSKCFLCKGSGEASHCEDLGDKADREYDEWRVFERPDKPTGRGSRKLKARK